MQHAAYDFMHKCSTQTKSPLKILQVDHDTNRMLPDTER